MGTANDPWFTKATYRTAEDVRQLVSLPCSWGSSHFLIRMQVGKVPGSFICLDRFPCLFKNSSSD